MPTSTIFGADLVIRSKLMPPRLGPRRVVRDRLNQHLGQVLDLPVTLMVAGAGYGKSTALADWLLETPWPVAWYSIAPGDHDPLLFLLHLIYTFDTIFPQISSQALTSFDQEGDPATMRQTALTRLLNELTERLEVDTLLVLDDVHLVADSPETGQVINQLITYLPPQLHLVLTARQRPELPALTRLDAQSQVAYIDTEQLAFQRDEATRLFRGQYNLPFSDRQIVQLLNKTEGWAIALHLIAQRADTNLGPLTPLDHSLESLFTFLAQDVLAHQPQAIQDFLTQTAILQQLTPTTCNYLLNINHSASILSELAERDFFVISLGVDTYRYHHLFADFLRSQLRNEAPLHHRIADYFHKQGRDELAVHHFLSAGAHAEAVELLTPLAPELVRAGRFDLLNQWLIQLPEALLEEVPELILAYGDLYRFTSQYQPALQRYQQAAQIFCKRNNSLGQSEALQGQARIYLDTVRPAKASHPLQQALALVKDNAQHPFVIKRAEILAMLAENEANLGNAARAKRLQTEATALIGQQSTSIEVETRLLLRSGRLDEAREKLAAQAKLEKRAQRAAWAPRHHREISLLLSLIYAMQGRPEKARTLAEEGVTIGQRLGAPFVEAVGYMRLGHAWQIGLDADPERAEAYYHQSLELSERFEVARAKVEPLWGLLRLHGYRGNLAAAERYGHEAIQLAQRAGDGWMLAWSKTMLAASYLVAEAGQAGLNQMQQAQKDFIKGGDPHGQAATLLWQAMYPPAADTQALAELLKLAQKEGYDFLFATPAFTAPVDPQATIPLLLQAREQKIAPDYVDRLLVAHNLSNAQTHPGFTLQAQTLGPFRTWRGSEPVPAQEWHRVKARHLFQLLLIHRGNYLQKEQILDRLWPDMPARSAEKHFKVALNMMQSVIEPNRPPRAPSFFVRRREGCYGLMPGESLLTDCDRFEQNIEQGRQAQEAGDLMLAIKHYRQAVDLYRGDFLEQSLYEDWTIEERERLLGLYLRTAERLARLHLQNGQPAEAIALCKAILSRDDCWEAAYRLLMVAYQRRGNRPQALRTFEHCTQVLKESLDVPPMEQTVKLHERILYHRSVSVQDA